MEAKKFAKGAAIVTGLGILGAITVDWVQRRAADITKNLTFFFDNFRIYGLVKDTTGHVNGNLRIKFDFSFQNYSDTSITIKKLFTTISYKSGSNWYPLGVSPTLVPNIILPSKKKVPVRDIPIDFNLLEIITSNWRDMLSGKGFTIRLENSFSIYGVTTSATPFDYTIKFDAATLAKLSALFVGKKGIAGAGPRVMISDLRLAVEPIQNTDITIAPGPATGAPIPATQNALQTAWRPQGIGMVASGRRQIKDGSQYDKLIKRGQSTGVFQLRKEANTEETLVEINKIVAECSWQVRDLVKQVLMAGNPSVDVFANRLYKFIYEHIAYENDAPGKEELREPGRLWADKKGDCDCFAIFIAACCREAGVKADFRVVKMHNREYFQHIYVIVPRKQHKTLTNYERLQKNNYAAIDPVWDFPDQDPASISYVMDVKAS